MSSLPVGDFVPSVSEVRIPRRVDYEGEYIALSPLDSEKDAPGLFACSHGTEPVEQLWTYMAYGPFEDVSDMQAWLEGIEDSEDPLFLSVWDKESDRPVGMVSFLNIAPDARRLELGNIWYGPEAQNTCANTEAAYLMLCEAFDCMRYRRVEWKCDALNERSRSAALRLGFTFEGLFRQHMIVKDRNRDTTWFAMLDTEWSRIKENMEEWLYHNPDKSWSLREKNQGLGGAK